MGFKHIVINKYEPKEDEKRLEELAAKGEFISSYTELLAYFKKGAPKKMRYCIEAGVLRPSRRQRKFYEESGWKPVCRGSDLTIFASEDENAVPIHTDRSEYAHVIQKFHRAAVKIFICLLIITFAAFTELFWLMPMIAKESVMYWANASDYMPLPLFLRLSFLQWLVMIPLLVFYFRDAVNAGKFVAGSIENGKSASKAVLLNRILTAALCFTLAVGAVCTAFLGYSVSVSESVVADISDLPAEAVTIDEIFPEENFIPIADKERMELYLEKYDDKITDKALCCMSAVTDEYFAYWQYGAYVPDGSDTGTRVTAEIDFISFKSEFFAKAAVKDIVRWEREIFVHPKMSTLKEFDAEGTPWDSIICLEGEKDGRFVFVLRKDRRLTKFSIFFHEDITQELLYEKSSVFKG